LQYNPSAWGTEVFSDDSSICIAGIHNGVITNHLGGTLSIGLIEGRKSYIGSESNDAIT